MGSKEREVEVSLAKERCRKSGEGKQTGGPEETTERVPTFLPFYHSPDGPCRQPPFCPHGCWEPKPER